MTLTRYLSRLLAVRVLMAFCGLAALLQILDLLDSADTLVAAGKGAGGMVSYALWRFPVIAKQVLPLAVLTGTLITFFSLVHSNEITALRAGGTTSYRIFACVLPVALAASALHYALVDQIAPMAERGFDNWWQGVKRQAGGGNDEGGKRASMRSGNTIILVGEVAEDRPVMSRLIFGTLNEGGLLERQIEARTAERVLGGWRLYDVRDTRITGEGASVSVSPEAPWPVTVSASQVAAATRVTDNLSSGQLIDLLENRTPWTDSPARYSTMLHHNLALPLAAPLMILLAMPAAYGSSRHGGSGRGFMIGFGLGMGYLVCDNILFAMGQVGMLPAPLAAWTAPAVFACVGGGILLKLEEP